jgi:hypothetical protein
MDLSVTNVDLAYNVSSFEETTYFMGAQINFTYYESQIPIRIR